MSDIINFFKIIVGSLFFANRDADLTKGTLGREFSKLSYAYHVITEIVLIIKKKIRSLAQKLAKLWRFACCISWSCEKSL